VKNRELFHANLPPAAAAVLKSDLCYVILK